jgi:hypothetical protein
MSASEFPSARALLQQARAIYDDPAQPFAPNARSQAWQQGFASGAEWMRLVLEQKRGSPPQGQANFQWLGILKYGLCSLGALLYIAVCLLLKNWWLLPGFVLVFYAIEAQMVFLFPVALDNTPHSFSANRRMTVQAGGTLRVMWTVMQLAVVMLFGGFAGRGFIRCWALGCLSVVLWYEHIRQTTPDAAQYA